MVRGFETYTEPLNQREREIVANAPRREWEKFKASGELDIVTDGYAAAVFDALMERGKINATDATRERAKAEARRQLESEARRLGGSILPYINAGEEYRTKRILLDAYFRTLRNRGIELN